VGIFFVRFLCYSCFLSFHFLAAKNSGNQGLFNNAAQAYNHAFYWNCMKQGGGGAPSGRIGDLINSSFGSYEKFRGEFESAATTAFGSAWAWLILENGSLKIVKTSNADSPVVDPNTKPLLTIVSFDLFFFRVLSLTLCFLFSSLDRMFGNMLIILIIKMLDLITLSNLWIIYLIGNLLNHNLLKVK
jgi:hypothetical protein